MPENERITISTQATPVRVAFKKTGSLSFISHLDLLRTVSRLLVRADIDVYYTEGFNPHPKLAFALPLSVGTGSETELFDIKVEGEADCVRIAERLRSVFPAELEITDVYKPERKFRDIAFAEYEIVIFHSGLTASAPQTVTELMGSPIVELKRTKSGEQECDIRPFIASLESEMRGGELVVKTRLSADSEHYLNPEYVVRAVKKALDIETDDIRPGGDGYTITRKRILDRDGVVFR